MDFNVTEAVLRTVGHLTSNLDLHTTGTTKTECVEFYADFVACYDAILTIERYTGENAFAISVLKDRLENGVDQNSIFVSSNTKGYPNVQVKNDTPYPVAHAAEESWGEGLANAQVEYGQFFCPNEDIPEGIAPGDTWTSTSRGLCSVMAIYVHLTLPDGKKLACYDFPSYGTSSPLYSIIMDGVDGCCVRNSQSTNKGC